MATSGSVNLSATATDIITEAMEQLGVLSEGESPSANALTANNRTLNYLVKALQADGLNLFALKRSYLFLTENTNEFTLSSVGAHWTDTYYSTQVAVAAVSTDGSVEVDDDSNMSHGDYIGIQCDDGTMHWTTINGAPAANVVTLTDALDADVAVDAYVFTYTTKAERPMKLYEVTTLDTSGGEIPVTMVKSPTEYIWLPNKTSDGRVNTVWWLPTRNSGILRVWPETDNVTTVLKIWHQRTLEDIDTVATDEVDYPQEWFLPLAFMLAKSLLGKYNPPAEIKNIIIGQANEWRGTVYSWDAEDGFNLQPETEMNRG